MSEDHLDPVVVDNGSAVIKAGFAGEDEPKVVFPAIIGRPKSENFQQKSTCYVGKEAHSKRDILTVTYPIESGIIKDWDDMENIWFHMFHDELKINPHDHSILLTEAGISPKTNREKMTQIMFESFHFPAMNIVLPNVLSLYSVGRTAGLVLESGDGVTQVIPVVDGYGKTEAKRHLNIAGRDLTNHLSTMFKESGYHFSDYAEKEIVRDIKETTCYIASDFEKEMNHANPTSIERSYHLPDGKEISIRNERFRCPEILFQPNLFGSEEEGVHEITSKSIENFSEEIKKTLLLNIVVTGGSTLIPGFAERMQKEIGSLVPSNYKTKICAPSERKYRAWTGGSVLASLSSFQKMWITKQQYEEYGTNIIHDHSF